jgi:hypothetical protein
MEKLARADIREMSTLKYFLEIPRRPRLPLQGISSFFGPHTVLPKLLQRPLAQQVLQLDSVFPYWHRSLDLFVKMTCNVLEVLQRLDLRFFVCFGFEDLVFAANESAGEDNLRAKLSLGFVRELSVAMLILDVVQICLFKVKYSAALLVAADPKAVRVVELVEMLLEIAFPGESDIDLIYRAERAVDGLARYGSRRLT